MRLSGVSGCAAAESTDMRHQKSNHKAGSSES
jgi:hypothetical protein